MTDATVTVRQRYRSTIRGHRAKRERGRPKIEVPIEPARREAADQIKRRDAREIARKLLQNASQDSEIVVPGSAWQLEALERCRSARNMILELEARGCARDGETVHDATIRILRRDGFSRRPVHRAVLGRDGGGEIAADRAGIEELEELKRIPERRALWGEAFNMPKWCRDAQLPDVKVRKLEGALAQLKRGWIDLCASEHQPQPPST
jgi:hypothetical protein